MVRAALVIFLIVAIGLGGAFCYFYIKYDRIIEQRFRSPVFSNSAKIYALPRTVRDGDNIDAKEIATLLRRAGYSDKDGHRRSAPFTWSATASRSRRGRKATTARKGRTSPLRTDK